MMACRSIFIVIDRFFRLLFTFLLLLLFFSSCKLEVLWHQVHSQSCVSLCNMLVLETLTVIKNFGVQHRVLYLLGNESSQVCPCPPL